MTLKIEITIPQEQIEARNGSSYLADAMAAIGFSRGVSLPVPAPAPSAGHARANTVSPVAVSASNETSDEAADKEAVRQIEAVQRERGKPSPGRARRTKEEIAEDEAADAAEAASGASETTTDKPLISTGEERHEPSTPEEDAQDAADEAADEANETTAEATREDVRVAMVAFQNDFGPADLVVVLTKAFAEIYPDQGVKNLKMAPEGAEGFAQILERLATARAAAGSK